MTDKGITAQRIAARMAEVNAQQDELAAAIGCSQGAISQILTGRTRNSRFLPRIAQHLDVTTAWLLGLTDNPYGEAPEFEVPMRNAVTMQVLLPNVEDLTQMFESMLATIEEGTPRAELPRMLALRLPAGMSHLELPPSARVWGNAISLDAGALPLSKDRRGSMR